MTKDYEIEFTALNAKEKADFLSTFGVFGFGPEAEFQEALFALLTHTRLYNTLRKSDGEPPEILEITFDRLWGCLETGEIVITPELEAFQECLEHCAGAFVNADFGMLESDEEDAFYARYFEGCDHGWEGFIDSMGHICFDIVGRTGCVCERFQELMEWTVETDIEYRVLGLKSLTGTTSQQDAWAAQARETAEFAEIVARLQEDKKAAVSGTPVPELRGRYQALTLFPVS